jgi:hypothetical protein
MANSAATLLFSCACLIGASAPLDGSQPLSVRVTPAMAPEPAAVMVTVLVEADDRNRSLEISASSDDYFRSSQVQLEGRGARRVFDFQFHDIPSGQYEVTGTLTGTDGRRIEVTRVFVVLSRRAR